MSHQSLCARFLTILSSSMQNNVLKIELQVEVFEAEEQYVSRISQLINKTNQFNVTTRRYSEERIKEFEDTDEFFTVQIGLSDKFGDNGTIGVVQNRPILTPGVPNMACSLATARSQAATS